MKNLICISIFSLFNFVCHCQGIFFTQNLTWQEVLEKARAENKYVFVDCYASWCGPCKLMDKKIYPDSLVGEFMKSNFISVRVQMDTTKEDDNRTQHWYAIAHDIAEKYHIQEYPGYLFFSPDGKVVHKDLGAMDTNAFLSMAKAAMDPRQQYYTLLSGYRHGEKDFLLMPVLADAAKKVGQDSLSKQVARDYILGYLQEIPDQQLWTRDNISFVLRYSKVISDRDAIFLSYFKNRKEIDSVMNDPKFANYLINPILYKYEIAPQIDEAIRLRIEPNWHKLKKAITKEYDAYYSEKMVLQGQINYYKAIKEWRSYVGYFIHQKEEERIENRRPDGKIDFNDFNNDAYVVFLYSSDKKQLRKALSWVNLALSSVGNSPSPDAMDTKANLLYKLGRKAEGLELERESYAIAPYNDDIKKNYEKMKKGLHTWTN